MWYFGICKVTVTTIIVPFTVLSQIVKSNVYLSNRQQLKCLNDIRDDCQDCSLLYCVPELCIMHVSSSYRTLFMAALCNRAGHIYIFILWFLLLSFFIPRLISAVGDWMSTMLPHMLWP